MGTVRLTSAVLPPVGTARLGAQLSTIAVERRDTSYRMAERGFPPMLPYVSAHD
ncbi:hypothetical protein [Nocardia sp. NPDC051570]|uniref:hypothetical protein n=1 Tax=Nocardia sp. NPDC051570 TaxID=3364324 RepID=UPI00378BB97F